MRRKSSGIAVLTVLVAVAAAAVVYIASFGGSSSHVDNDTVPSSFAEWVVQASAPAFELSPAQAASDAQAQTAAR